MCVRVYLQSDHQGNTWGGKHEYGYYQREDMGGSRGGGPALLLSFNNETNHLLTAMT